MRLTSLVFASLVALGLNAPVDHQISAMPGWNTELPTKMYSGFLPVGANKKLHYLFVEAEAPLDPSTAPVVLWLNGGPGCSSLEGFFYEHGTLVVADAHAPPNINFASDASPNTNLTLVRNPWAWSRAANMLYLEAPAGVGFSYSKDKNDLKTGDNQTAADNLAALHRFFDAFPEYRTNPFYVSGESYGGVYVPTLSQKIYEDESFPGKMTGYLVGNGVFDHAQSADTHVPFAYGHGVISTKLYKKISKACDSYLNPSAECKALIDQVDDLEVDMNGYDAYRTCYHPPSPATPFPPHNRTPTVTPTAVTGGDKASASFGTSPGVSSSVGSLLRIARQAHDGNKDAVIDWFRRLRESVPCINSIKGTAYLNRVDVRRALHVDESPNTWAICGGVDYSDDGVYSSLVAVHKEMLRYKPRVLVYNGDVDPGCNYLWAEASVEQFGLDVTEGGDWHPWVYEDALVGEQLGGYATNYLQNVTMATIHGAGHMSPQWRPEAAFNLFSRFLDQGHL